MNKVLSEGTIDVDGEKIHYKYYLDRHLPQGGYYGYVKAYYDGAIFVEDDHGWGIEHALSLLLNDVKIHKSNREDATKK